MISLEGADHQCGNDVVAIRLAETTTLPAVEPRLDRAPELGEHLTVIGFGQLDPADADSFGPRRRRDDAIVSILGPRANGVGAGDELTASDFAVSIGPCHGDSGGPALDASGRAVGVMSRGGAAKSTCTDMIYTRLDVHAEWVRKVVRDAAVARGGTVPDWAAEAVGGGAPDRETDPDASAPAEAPVSASPTTTCTGSGAPPGSAAPASIAPLLLAFVLAVARRR